MSEAEIQKTALAQTKSPVKWGPVEALVIALASYFGGQIVASIVVLLYPMSQGWSVEQMTDWTVQSTFAQFAFIVIGAIATVGIVYAFIRAKGADWRALGLTKPRLSDAGYAVMGYGIYLPALIVTMIATQILAPSVDLEQEQQLGFENVPGGPGLLLVFISLVVLPPLVEEIVVRGFLYKGLRSRLPRIWAVLLTSGLFAIAHLQFGSGAPLLWAAAIDTFVLSLVLIYVLEKSGRLWASIGLHAIKNVVAFSLIFILT